MPLRLSEGRGQYRIAKYRIQQTELDRDLKQKLIQNKVSMEFQQLTQIQKQLSIQQSLLRNQVCWMVKTFGLTTVKVLCFW
jgi:hypothetical protein